MSSELPISASSNESPGRLAEIGPFRVGDWLVDPGANRISLGSRHKNLRHKAMELLVMLAENPERTVGRDEIIAKLWDGNDYVGGKGITNTVWALRQAFGDTADNPRFIETIPKKGYRLLAPVEFPEPEPPLVIETSIPALDNGADVSRKKSRKRRWWPLAALGLALLSGGGGYWLSRMSAPEAPGLSEHGDISFLPQEEFHRTLSPDGKRMAFAWRGSEGGAIYVRTMDDPEDVPVVLVAKPGELYSPTWSPTGLELAYLHMDRNGQCRVFIYDLVSRREQALTSCLGSSRNLLSWSPDGTWLAFTDGAMPGHGAGGIQVISPAGRYRRQLTEASNPLALDLVVSWTPDSKSLVFSRPQVRGFRSYYQVDLDGKLSAVSDDVARSLFAAPSSAVRLRQRN